MIYRYKLYKLPNGIISITFINKDTDCPIQGQQGQLIKFKD